ncbi:hypothetical protein HYPSUDRAFT_55896 [Hypholoma sublateritium FD-334 SS-4]|uniref:Cyclin N-terminal domain-containing protein n=1 Tax=Hypholoma sublateritium (strain FD-334 SS-4) TaxID=945553 RepID=A0A0D2NW86_HYPSF|nr:hypothetical protein HYPSUDRAFT_55896 [Hypholoma sublateritium FD-334 SS-4]
MHSATQLIAQRAPPAIRTKTRWQPYHSVAAPSTPLALRSPTVSCSSANTPMPFVVPSQDSRQCDLPAKELLHPHIPPTPLNQPQTSKDPIQRDASKHKFAAGLIDQAVNILSEIWRPQDVPDIFKAPSKGSPLGSALGHAMPLSAHQSLPSMASTSHISQPPPSIAAMMAHHHSSFTSPSPQALISAADNLLPMKTFVHEVLKRSRTSGSILQAALCYLEAIRSKVPEILQQEKMGIRAHYQPETKILPATEAELAHEAELAALEDAQGFVSDTVEQLVADETKTVRVTDSENDQLDSMQHILDEDRASISSLVVEPSAPADSLSAPSRSQNLPSPLLCPRRAFLASLILASKFFQDKCYSNRAWAKLSGLPPREIGRCERALGQALEWRLWVGKSSLQAFSAPPTRTLSRSQSENIISSSSSQTLPVLAGKPVRKCATILADGFAEIASSYSVPLSHNPASSQDQIMSETENTMSMPPLSAAFRAPSSQFTEQGTSTPSPDTPALTYSPSSTDSSGDRTIQMSTFEDGMFPGSQPWTDTLSTSTLNTCSTDSSCKHSAIFGASRMIKSTFDIVSVADSELGSYGSHMGTYPWQVDSQFISLETTGVH